MSIYKAMGVYILMDRARLQFFTGKTRADVIEKACWAIYQSLKKQ